MKKICALDLSKKLTNPENRKETFGEVFLSLTSKKKDIGGKFLVSSILHPFLQLTPTQHGTTSSQTEKTLHAPSPHEHNIALP